MDDSSNVKLMPLNKFVVVVTNEAMVNDKESNKKASKSWHNRLNNGTVPRYLFKKIGKQLFVDLAAFNKWVVGR